MSIKNEAIKFTVVGSLNFILTFVVFTSMLKVLMVNHLISLASSWAAGMVFSYVLNYFWVFRFEKRNQLITQFPKFFAASSLSITLNLLILDFLVKKFALDPFYVQVGLIPFIVVFNFSTAKYWSFRQPVKEITDEF